MTIELVALYIAAVVSLVGAQAPQFDNAVPMGPEGGIITGRLVLSGLQAVTEPGTLEFEIIAGGVPGAENSAIEDQDFVLNTSVVSFRPGNESSSEFVIQLLNDMLNEGDEVFKLSIRVHIQTGIFRSVRFGLSAMFTITIKDDINDEVVCRLIPIGEKDSPLSTLVEEGVKINITSCCEGQFERTIMIGMSCQDIIVAPGAATLPAKNILDYNFPPTFQFIYTPPNERVECVEADNVFVVMILDDEAKGESIEQFTCDLRLGSGVSSLKTEDKEVTIEIEDSDFIAVSWRNFSYRFKESMSQATVQVNASDRFSNPRQVHTRPSEIRSILPSDYFLTNFMGSGARATVDFMGVTYYTASFDDVRNEQVSFEFVENSDLATDNFTINEDDTCEPDEIIRASFVDDQPNLNITYPEVTYIIIEDNDFAEIGFSDVSLVIDEDAGSVEVSVETSARISLETIVNITCFPQNASEMTFNKSDFSVSFRVRGGFIFLFEESFEIPIVDDSIPEPTECLLCEIISIDGPKCAFIGNRNRSQICIRDNDVKVPVIIHNQTVFEGEEANITLELESPLESECSITVRTMDVSAIAPDDYMSGPYTVVFPAGNTKAFLIVMTNDDDIAELMEKFTVTIVDTCDLASPGNPSTGYVHILDNDIITCSKASQRATVNEGSPAEIAVNCSGQYDFDFTLSLDNTDGSAVAPDDYTPGEYLLPFSGDQKSAILTVATVVDSIAECDESFQTKITKSSRPEKVKIVNPDTCDVVIEDNNVLMVMFDPVDYEVSEGVTADVMLVTNLPYSFNFSVVVACVNGSAFAPGDFIAEQYTVNFPASPKGPGMASIPVQTLTDNVLEDVEFLKCNILEVISDEACFVLPGPDDMARVNITDNSTITCSKSPENATVTEGGVARLTVECSGQTEFNFTLFLDTMDGSAVAPGDYTSGGYSLSFTAGQTSSVLSVQTSDDTIAELEEFFKVMITRSDRPDKVIIGDPDTCFVTIQDNDVITCSKAPENATVTEGGVAGLTVVCSGEYEFDFTLFLDTMDGSAVAPGDYTSGGYSLSFTAGQTSDMLSVQTSDDTIAELEEFFKVMITGSDRPDKVIIGDPDTCFVTIQDNDVITCSKAPENATVTEGDVAGLTVECSGEYEFDFTLFLDTMDGSAVAPGDYTSGGYSLSFTAGQTSDMLSVQTSDDTIAELEEFFKVMITGSDRPDKVIIGDPDTCFVTIQDNDVITCSKAPENATVTEGGVANLTVVCSGEYEFDFTLFLNTMNGSAFAPGDYTSERYSLSFTAGQTSDMLSVATNNDNIAECEEFFKVMITGSNLTAGKVLIGDPNICFVTIEDDDDLDVCINVTSCLENAGTCQVCVVANRAAECAYSVSVKTKDGTAVAPEDYISQEMNFNVRPFETRKCIDLEIVDDNCVEDREEFSLELGIGEDSPFTNVQFCNETDVPIVDNDAQVNFTKEMYQVNEGRTVPLGLTISGNISMNFTVEIIVKPGGTATESEDFTDVPRLVNIPRGLVGTNFNFMAICDNITEGQEYVELEIVVLQNSSYRVKAISPITTQVNIIDICEGPQRGTKPVNDSVIADPLYTVPLCTMNTSNIIEGTPLCYEVHGIADHYFNLVSDDCTSVNAHYVAAVRPRAGNVIDQIGIVTSDSRNRCHRIQVDVTSDGQCQTQIEGVGISGATNTSIGVNVMAGRHYVRVSTRNCMEQDLVMWIRCHNATLNQTGDSFEQPMIKFVVTRGLETRSEAHGLIGQFWGVCVNVTRYAGGLLPSAQAHSDTYYTLHFNAASPNQRRTFTAKLGWTTWRLNFIPTLPGFQCFYAGNSQGGRSIEATDPGVQDSVIEGKYQDYMASGLFDTQWHNQFSRFTAVCNFIAP